MLSVTKTLTLASQLEKRLQSFSLNQLAKEQGSGHPSAEGRVSLV